jgi:Ca2+-binding RTX toxin-like protein
VAVVALVLVSVVPAAALRVVGTAGDDTLVGTAADDYFKAKSGDDTVLARSGRDLIRAGPGHDVLRGGPGNDRLIGQHGDDTFYGGRGRDYLNLGWGRDTGFAGPDNDQVRIAYGAFMSDPLVKATVTLGAGNDLGYAVCPTGMDAEPIGHAIDDPLDTRFTLDLKGGPGRDDIGYGGPAFVFEGWGSGIYTPQVMLRGGRGADRISISWTAQGSYKVIAGPGDDLIDVVEISQVWAGRGDDVILVEGDVGVVDCGPGTDTVKLLETDTYWYTDAETTGCERIIDQR